MARPTFDALISPGSARNVPSLGEVVNLSYVLLHLVSALFQIYIPFSGADDSQIFETQRAAATSESSNPVPDAYFDGAACQLGAQPL